LFTFVAAIIVLDAVVCYFKTLTADYYEPVIPVSLP
jgi:hypothetical protein